MLTLDHIAIATERLEEGAAAVEAALACPCRAAGSMRRWALTTG